MQLRRPERSGAAASLSAPRAPLWTQLDASAPQDERAASHTTASSPAARSGHAMTLLPTASVLLFGGADGQVFFEDVFLLEPAGYAASISSRSSPAAPRGRGRAEDAQLQASDVQWKRLVVSRGSSQSPRSPLFRSGDVLCSGVVRRAPCLSHPGGGRDYHSMHYVQSSAEDERAQGLRVLVVGNVVVASDDAVVSDTQAEAGAGAFNAPTLRVKELRVRHVDAASMWKPRARHAHSSVVVGGDQVFVFGGKDASSSTFFNDIFYFDAPLNQWVKPAVNPTGQLPQPRALAGLTASDDGNMLFLFGGTDGKQEFGSLFLYDVANARWDSLAGATLGDRPSCRINHSLTFAAPNHLVLFGGRRRALRQNELYVYNVDIGWFTADTLKGREAVAAGVAKRLGMINLLSGEQHTLRRVDAAAVYKQKLISIDGSHATYPTNTSLF
ncbi:Kelch repeat-containing protein [Phytophthora cinnamomi]|uniref:Kelch repeat-containing protein n=1 Tax=Phytophthora cinnamomi TaxID=4785 RepID=UPI0035599694|nr:Kelch repeat-containing protein [Phytophthora cinnamomi]